MLKKDFVVDFSNAKASLINDRDYTSMRLFNEIADNLVVKVVDVYPVDVLALVFLLLLF